MKVYVLVSLQGGIPHVEAVHNDYDSAVNYFREFLLATGSNVQWELSDNNGNCVMYAVAPDLDSDLRLYERNLL